MALAVFCACTGAALAGPDEAGPARAADPANEADATDSVALPEGITLPTVCDPYPADPNRIVVDRDDAWVAEVLQSEPLLRDLSARAEELRLQIVVGEIDRSSGEPPLVRFHPYRLDADYIYPASAIKTFGAFAALRVFQELSALHPSLTLDTRIEFADLETGLRDTLGEPVVVSEEDRTTLRDQLERTLVVSSNEGFNRLWDISGHDGINGFARGAGFDSVRFHHRLSRQGLPPEAHRLSPAIRAQLDGEWVELIPQRDSHLEVDNNEGDDIEIGEAHIAPLSEERVEAPLDFSQKNGASILDMLLLVAWVADPELVPSIDLELSEENREVLLEIMSRVPSESARFKPFSPGITEVTHWDNLTYVNKAGRAYGFHLDAAYVRDESTGREFLLAAAMHTNPNGVMNDSTYDYEGTSFPFMVALGEAVARRLLE